MAGLKMKFFSAINWRTYATEREFPDGDGLASLVKISKPTA
jgi:hypothetical protein